MNLATATIADLINAGISVTLNPVALTLSASEAPVVAPSAPVEALSLSGVLKEGTDDLIRVTSQRGHVLRTYSPKHMSKNGAKIAEAMRVCASEGWHLWEMQFACYCHEFGFSPGVRQPSRESGHFRAAELPSLHFRSGCVPELFQVQAFLSGREAQGHLIRRPSKGERKLSFFI